MPHHLEVSLREDLVHSDLLRVLVDLVLSHREHLEGAALLVNQPPLSSLHLVEVCVTRVFNLFVWTLFFFYTTTTGNCSIRLRLEKYEFLIVTLRGFAPNKLLILPTAKIQNKCECRLTLMNSL